MMTNRRGRRRALAKDHLGRVALHLAALRGFNEVRNDVSPQDLVASQLE